MRIKGDQSLARHTGSKQRILGYQSKQLNGILPWIRPIVYFVGTKYLSQKIYISDKYCLSALCLDGHALGTVVQLENRGLGELGVSFWVPQHSYCYR